MAFMRRAQLLFTERSNGGKPAAWVAKASIFRLAMAAFEADAGGLMYSHFDPEGNASVLTENSALSLTIPGDQNVHLYASFDSAWEQAVVIYVDGERYD